MKLSNKEKHLIALMSADAKMSIKEVQEITGYREHTIRYALNRLRQEKIILPVALVDMYKVGYLEYSIYFSLKASSKEQRAAIMQKFLESPNVPWCVEMGGEYEYTAAYQAPHIHGVVDFLNCISEKFGNVFLRKSIHLRLFVNIYNWGFLHPSAPRKFVTLGNTQKSFDMDDTDHQILLEVQRDGWQSHAEIGKRIGVPASTVSYRTKKLEETKIIDGYWMGVNQNKVGAHVSELFLYVKGVNPELQKRLHQFALDCPHVIHFLQGIGEWDFEFGVAVEQQQKIRDIIEDLHQEFGDDIVMIKSFPIFRYLKSSMSLYEG